MAPAKSYGFGQDTASLGIVAITFVASCEDSEPTLQLQLLDSHYNEELNSIKEIL
jgi:hypothetical protein